MSRRPFRHGTLIEARSNRRPGMVMSVDPGCAIERRRPRVTVRWYDGSVTQVSPGTIRHRQVNTPYPPPRAGGAYRVGERVWLRDTSHPLAGKRIEITAVSPGPCGTHTVTLLDRAARMTTTVTTADITRERTPRPITPAR